MKLPCPWCGEQHSFSAQAWPGIIWATGKRCRCGQFFGVEYQQAGNRWRTHHHQNEQIVYVNHPDT